LKKAETRYPPMRDFEGTRQARAFLSITDRSNMRRRWTRRLRQQVQQNMMLTTRSILALAPLAAAFALLSPAQALAQPPAQSSDTAADAPTGGSEKISLDDDFLVEGELEKPSAFYVFRRSELDYDWARLDAKFTPLVLESVQDPLF
jgi:hypothetical protein